VPVVIFCIASVNEGEEIDLGRNIYATRPDNFNQLRSFLRRLLEFVRTIPSRIFLPKQTLNFLFYDPITFANGGFQAFAI
jgi:hypothetical protein